MREWSVAGIAERVNKGEITPTAVVEHFLERIRRASVLNAFIQVKSDTLAGERSTTLGGVPIAVKDLVDIAGEATTAASRVLAGHVAKEDAEVIARLREAGAIFLGKTNLHEFAYGGSGMISAFGPARNPWDTARITGGSSSGSAAAVAAGLCAAAVGTDTAGSIRLPASLCGIVGFKPTFGVVSTKGVIPLSDSYDHVGPMTSTVEDARIVFCAMTGHERPASSGPRKLRIGVPELYFYRDLQSEVADAVDAAMSALRRAGHSLITRDFAVDEDRTLSTYQSYQYHKEWVAKSPELYDPETLRRIRSGEKTTDDAAREAAARLQKMREEAEEIFSDVDVLLTPTVPILPPKISDLLEKPETLRPAELVMLRNTRPFNVLGVPAISVPWDLAANGLPIGIQLAAAPGKDFELLDAAEEFERLAPWQGRTPPEFS